jgi:hypothetical protein
VKILKCAIVGFAAGITLSAHACTILEFAAENLLNAGQNTPEVTFQELEAFAAGVFATRPIFTGSEPRFEMGLNAPIDLAGFGYAVVHYAPGTSGNPTINQGGSLVFYHIAPGKCSFIFPQTGPDDNFSNGPITSVSLFFSVPVSDAGASVLLFSIALGGVLLMNISRHHGDAPLRDVSLRRPFVHNKTR